MRGTLSAKNLLTEHLKSKESAKKDTTKMKNLNLRESFKSGSYSHMSDCELVKMESIGSVLASREFA